MSDIYKKLVKVQSDLKVPKNNFNDFGKYSYRSCEDILEAVKPLLREQGLVLTLRDEIVQIGDRYYVKAIAEVCGEGDETFQVSSYARESEVKKGMDESQITGTASSYARKYALNGLFAIDDTKDADTNEHKKQADNAPAKPKASPKKSISNEQSKLIIKLMTEKGAPSQNDQKFLLKKLTDKDSLKTLTQKDASKLIEQLMNISKEKVVEIVLDNVEAVNEPFGGEDEQ